MNIEQETRAWLQLRRAGLSVLAVGVLGAIAGSLLSLAALYEPAIIAALVGLVMVLASGAWYWLRTRG